MAAMDGALEILKRERNDASDQIRMLRSRIKDLEAAISVLEAQPAGHRASRTGNDLKSGVISKLLNFGSTGATPKEIADALTSDGRITSDASVSSTLSRLKSERKVLNQTGRWFAVLTAASDLESQMPGVAESVWDDDDPFG